MIAFAIAAMLTMQAAPVEQPHSLSSAAGKPLLVYLGCLFDPLARRSDKDLPKTRADRERLASLHLSACATVRAGARTRAYAAAATDAERAEVDRSLAAADDRLRFVIVDHEQAVAADAAFCRARGEEPGC